MLGDFTQETKRGLHLSENKGKPKTANWFFIRRNDAQKLLKQDYCQVFVISVLSAAKKKNAF